MAVVTNVGGASEILENNISGFVADDVSVTSINDALERAWDKRQEWESMGEKAYHIYLNRIPNDPVAFFSNKLEHIYKSYLNQ